MVGKKRMPNALPTVDTTSKKVESALPPTTPISQEDIAAINAMLDNNYSYDAISNQLGISKSSVGKYAKEYTEAKHQREPVTALKPERTVERLLDMILSLPQVGDVKGDLVRMVGKTNPLVLDSPHELYMAMTRTMKIEEAYADLVVKGFFQDLWKQNPQAAYQYLPPNGMGANSPVPMYPQGAPQFQMMQTPTGPVWMPAPAQQQPATLGEMQRLVDQSRDADYVEEQFPVQKPDGSPMLGPDGQPLYRTVRKPAGMTDPTQQMMSFVSLLSAMQNLTTPKQSQVSPEQLMAMMNARQAGPDPATLALVESMRSQNATLMAQFAEMRGRQEVAEVYGKRLWQSEQEKMHAENQMAIAKSGLSPEAQVQLEVTKGAMNAVSKSMDNMNQRMDRTEKVIAPLLRGMIQTQPQPGMPVSPTVGELEQIAADAGGEKPLYPRGYVPTT